MPGPFLFCYDGSKGSRGALRSAGDLMARPSDGFVLTVWQPAALRLAVAGTFAPAVLSDEEEIDNQEQSYAHRVAEEGVELARAHGYDLTALVERAGESVPHTIIETARRLDVSLIVCGQRGRGALRSALLGSVSHSLVAHAARPYCSPQRRSSREATYSGLGPDLERAGVHDIAIEASRRLDDPVDQRDLEAFLQPYGITHYVLVSLMGGSP